MTILGPLALYGFLSAGDEYTSQGPIWELGHRGWKAKVVQTGCFTAADMAIQWKKPKLRWWYRGAVTAGHILVMRHNTNITRGAGGK